MPGGKKTTVRKTKTRHWTPFEDLRYNLFLVATSSKALQVNGNKENGFYLQMSDFIGTKSSTQCRSHHQKRLTPIKEQTGLQNKWKIQLINLKNFYQVAYLDRLDDEAKLFKELRHHLKKQIQRNTPFKPLYESYFENIEQIVAALRLEEPQQVAVFEQEKMNLENQPPNRGMESEPPIFFIDQNSLFQVLNQNDVAQPNDQFSDSLFFDSQRGTAKDHFVQRPK